MKRITNISKRIIPLFLLLCFFTDAKAGEDKTATLTVLGTGKSKQEAKYDAFRNALERTFGTFISSNTTLIYDELVNDRIASISKGNIKEFEILNEKELPNGTFSTLIKVTVSIDKLTAFCESKGITIEFKGSLFSANVKLQELNKKNEEMVCSDLFSMILPISNNIYDFEIKVLSPKQNEDGVNWNIPIDVIIKPNKNFEIIEEIIKTTLEKLMLNDEEKSFYTQSNIKFYNLLIAGKSYSIRSPLSFSYISCLYGNVFPYMTKNFYINNGIEKIKGYNLINRNTIEGYEPENPSNYKLKEIKIEKDGKRWSKGETLYIKYMLKAYLYSKDEIEKVGYGLNYIDYSELKSCQMTFYLINKLSTSQLEQIKEYKIEPIIE